MDDVTILHGDALTMLRTLPDCSVHCVVTSPPYWGLRDYGTATWIGGDEACDHKPRDDAGRTDKPTVGQREHAIRFSGEKCWKCGALRIDKQIGLEPTPDAYVARLVEVFWEVWRVLRDDGTLWLNLGDSYASNPRGNKLGDFSTSSLTNPGRQDVVGRRLNTVVGDLKQKDLVGIPWRVAFALQADGWWLRSDIIWAKPNAMPESVMDRPTKSHEYMFLLTKSAQYYYDHVAILDPYTGPINRWGGQEQNSDTRKGRAYRDEVQHFGAISATRLGADLRPNKVGRNRRSVWTIPTQAYSGAHFAVFPPKLVEPCILAGTSERGCCPVCGAPWVRIIEKEFKPQSDVSSERVAYRGKTLGQWKGMPRGTNDVRTIGWESSCSCDSADPIPATVLDPFVGSGTTLAVAMGLGRRGIGIELNASYIEMALERIIKVQRPLLL